eukprot:TRINITY_DN76638_c0_g1_i1.p1 TRINITY_DN76638_c0_g1~~TRINITY_DN76638_c0_g1_i1.p1  ORF type:complete len:257 (-),score=24.74 TRINITY_DN76638_c0_g1_i1:167-937(-)
MAMLWSVPGARWLSTQLNKASTLVPPPPRAADDTDPRKILLVHVHPCRKSFSTELADAVEEGARSGGHDLRRRSLCQEAFQPVMDEAHWLAYQDVRNRGEGPQVSATVARFPQDTQKHLEDLRWCDSVVFVYPTWWFNVPAVLKGYFDRVFVPGADGAWDLPAEDGSDKHWIAPNGLVPRLTNVRRILGVTTYGASRSIAALAGDNGRNMIGTCVRANFNPDCPVTWFGLYSMSSKKEQERKEFLCAVREFVKHRF